MVHIWVSTQTPIDDLCISLSNQMSPEVQSLHVILPHVDQRGKEGRERHVTENQGKWPRFGGWKVRALGHMVS